MAVNAGSILTVGGANVIDRIQSAGLGDAQVPINKIQEVGNDLVVDKIPGEPDFTFSMESLDVSTDLMAFLTGKVGAADGATAPGSSDPAGTEYKWSDVGPVNIVSPWKDPQSGLDGTVNAGHLVPGYYPTSLRYQFGATDNAQATVELAGGSYFYAKSAPVEAFAAGDGAKTAFVTPDDAVPYRLGGAGGTTFRYVFGVIVGGVVMNEGADFTVTGGDADPATITFAKPPKTGATVRFCYFTTAAKAYPQAAHASTVIKPGAVRGRNIQIYLGEGAQRQRLASVQTYEQTSTVDGATEREMGSEEPVGRTINGLDTNGTVTIRSKNSDAFFGLLSKITGVSEDEVFGYLNLNAIPLEVAIENPKNPGQIAKTIYIPDALFSVPGTPARVNQPTDFSLRFESLSGTFSEFKGAKP